LEIDESFCDMVPSPTQLIADLKFSILGIGLFVFIVAQSIELICVPI